MNRFGDILFGGGFPGGSATGVDLVSSDQYQKIATWGFPLEGVGNGVFLGSQKFALNERGQVAFEARLSGSDIFTGLFLFSGDRVRPILLRGDPAPGAPGQVFLGIIEEIRINKGGMILFRAFLGSPEPISQTLKSGLFLFSNGRIEKIVLQGESPRPGVTFEFSSLISLSFNEEGVVTFSAGYGGIFRFADGALTELVGLGDPAPGGGAFSSFSEVVPNERGDIVFRAFFASTRADQGLFFLGRDGRMVRILADGDRTPLGGVFSLWSLQPGRFGTTQTIYFPMAPGLNDEGTVVFAGLVQGGSAPAALFFFSAGQIKPAVVHADPAPDGLAGNLFFSGASYQGLYTRHRINNLNMVVFEAYIREPAGSTREGLFLLVDGRVRKIILSGETHAETGGQLYPYSDHPLLLNDFGEVAFQAEIRDGRFARGIFISSLTYGPPPNADFETAGKRDLPAGWPTVWHNEGSGRAFQSVTGGSDSFQGQSHLRLHVHPGGGSTFVLSDPIPAAPERAYFFSSRLRFNLESSADSVYFSVIELDRDGNEVAGHETRGRRGDNFWRWQRQRVPIRTGPATVAVRIRYGLVSAGESYLDVDDLR